MSREKPQTHPRQSTDITALNRGTTSSRSVPAGPGCLAGRALAADADATSDWRMLAAGPFVAVATMLVAFLATDAAGLPLRDPDHVAGRRLLIVIGFVLALVVVDVFVRARRRSGLRWPTRHDLQHVRRARWTRGRGVAVGLALVSFYVTYLAYRNLKSVLPLLRPGDLFDTQLAALDRALFLGADPAVLMHDLLGTGLATHALSFAYLLFFLFIPATLALALVFSPDLRTGLFYVTAQSLNWVLGAASYYVLPALGPIYADPSVFSGLPATSVGRLQDVLLDQRLSFVADPQNGGAQSIAAFSSLHVSIFFTAALTAHLLGLGRTVRFVAWALLGFTTAATIFLGWHYVVDDVGGVVLAILALLMAKTMTGFELPARRRAARAARVPA